MSVSSQQDQKQKSSPKTSQKHQITIESLGRLFKKGVDLGLRDALASLLKEYNAERLTQLNETDYADVQDKAKAIIELKGVGQ